MTFDAFIVCLTATIALAAFELWRSARPRRLPRALRGSRLVLGHWKTK